MDIIVKTAKDVTNFDKLSLVARVLSISLPIISERIIRKGIDLFSLIYWILGIIALFIISFLVLFIKNYFVKSWLEKNIKIVPVNPDEFL